MTIEDANYYLKSSGFSDEQIDAIANAYAEQEPNKEAYNQGYEDGYLAGQKNIAERFEGLIKSGISTDTPDDIKYVIGLLNELPPVNPQEVGHWIEGVNGHFNCSECNTDFFAFRDIRAAFIYCPYCGVRMEGGKE